MCVRRRSRVLEVAVVVVVTNASVEGVAYNCINLNLPSAAVAVVP